jgi:hypothetical protein
MQTWAVTNMLEITANWVEDDLPDIKSAKVDFADSNRFLSSKKFRTRFHRECSRLDLMIEEIGTGPRIFYNLGRLYNEDGSLFLFGIKRKSLAELENNVVYGMIMTDKESAPRNLFFSTLTEFEEKLDKSAIEINIFGEKHSLIEFWRIALSVGSTPFNFYPDCTSEQYFEALEMFKLINY